VNIHERLRHARERAGLTGVQAAAATGIGGSTISEFESGKRTPSLSQLQRLATAYRRSTAFFFDEGPIATDVVLWRERPAEGAEDVETRFLRFCEQYHNLEVWCGERTPQALPLADGGTGTFGYPDAQRLAKQVRDQMQLGDRPGAVLLRVLEEIWGVKVLQAAFEPSGTAACAQSETFGAAVLLNALNARWRRNYDLAHELFHLLTWRLFRKAGEDAVARAGDHEEKLANCFASHLLMPEEAVRAAVEERTRNGRVAMEALFDVARQFDVSIEALIWRLHFLRRSPAGAEQTRKDIECAQRVARLYEQRERDEPLPWPARYQALAVKALRHGEISLGRFAEYLGLNRQEALRYVEEEATDGEEVQLAPA